MFYYIDCHVFIVGTRAGSKRVKSKLKKISKKIDDLRMMFDELQLIKNSH